MRAHKWILIASLAVAIAFSGVLSGVRIVERLEAAAVYNPPVTVVIDAGHGGEDGGAVSVSGALESHINLEISQRLDDILTFAGVQTVMVRESDTAIYDMSAKTISEKKVSDLKNRVKLVNETPDALLVSIHQNLFPDGKYSGAQVFYANTNGSKELAEYTQQSLIQLVDSQNRRQIKPADKVYLMNHIRCTGILVECGFLSNQQEDLKLQDAAYQKKLALAIGHAITHWANEEFGRNEV